MIKSLSHACFYVLDQESAKRFYTEKLGFEVRADVRFGEGDAMRWLEVAPPGSNARLALNPPMRDTPGGSAIGVETADVRGEHGRLTALGDVDVDAELMNQPGTPTMFSLRDPDGNHIWVVETAQS